MRRSLVLSLGLLLAACSSATPISGKLSLTLKGSDTGLVMFSNIAEAFAKVHPEAEISVAGGGAGPGIVAWINGDVDVATSSRELTDQEVQAAKAKGITPERFVPATDGLTVIVNPANPVRKMTVDQVGQIYQGKITNWKEVGGNDAPVNVYGRHSITGTYAFFRSAVVKGDYAKTMKEFEGDQDIIDTLKTDPNAIGYVGVGWVVDQSGAPRTDIATVDLPSKKDPSTYVSSQDEVAVLSGAYPVARPLQLFFNGVPSKSSLLGQFLTFCSSPAALDGIKKAGFYKPSLAEDAKNAALLQQMQ